MSDPIYAIGDIHGQLDELNRVLDLVERDGGPEARIVFLGDYVDRGPASRAVIDRLIEGRAAHRNWTYLLGNHDRMFSWFMEQTPRHDPHLLVGYHWLHERLGGSTTLASYGVEIPDRIRLQDLQAEALNAVPPAHLAFLNSLKPYHLVKNVLFVHAGIRPEIPLAAQQENDLVWIREEFHQFHDPHPWLVVHGHTPVAHATDYGNRINLDTGAGYGKPLTAAVFDGEGRFVLTNQGRKVISAG